jgi:hypothetical protein
MGGPGAGVLNHRQNGGPTVRALDLLFQAALAAFIALSILEGGPDRAARRLINQLLDVVCDIEQAHLRRQRRRGRRP